MASVKTTQFVDPRIEPQPEPVYDYIIGPTQNQYYKIPASGRSDSNITFNNLTTLGIDRAYLDTFEIEIGATIRFELNYHKKDGATHSWAVPTAEEVKADPCPRPDEWTFQSFPFNTCCEEARVNINGGAFFSQPLCYVRAKERYMNQHALSRCYENVCPIHKPILQTESAKNYSEITPIATAHDLISSGEISYPTRYGVGMEGYMQSSENILGGFNNSIVHLGAPRKVGAEVVGWENDYYEAGTDGKFYHVIHVKWREPLFVSPFSSKYDATYGRPLYNITSMDLSFNLMNLGNMIRVCNLHHDPSDENAVIVKDYSIHITSANLCYQVLTIPSNVQKPLSTLVPYRRFVPYITQYSAVAGESGTNTVIPVEGQNKVEIRSGVYTLNEMPTAVWVFCAPTKDIYQTNPTDAYRASSALSEDNVAAVGNWDSNNLFGFIRKVNISLANTTQILNTAEVHDLYRIAKANGCEDSYWSWSGNDIMLPKNVFVTGTSYKWPLIMARGAGSVLRLKPGVDMIVPDVPLIPGANANNMVLQVTAEFDIPPHSEGRNKYALWLLFEYVGVASITPGQCEITMNPLGSGEIMGVSPVMSATSDATEGALEGMGFWDNVKKGARIAGQLADDGIISKILRRIPGMGKAADWAAAHGLGEPAPKRGRSNACGGAVIGHGLNDWV